MKSLKISNFHIGTSFPVFIIAEAGINHNGSLTIAKKMVDVAKKAGVSCIKFQTHIADQEMIKTNIRPGKISRKTLWNIIKNCELSETEELKLQKYCKKEKILFLSTPFSIEAVQRLEKLRIPAYKIGSGELTNLPFLETVAKTGKPIILSTGMSTISEIRSAVKIFKKYKNLFALLQTTSTYPSDYSEIKLGMIEKLQDMFDVPVGLSDHSIGIYTAIASVAKGASIIEKHFTLDKKMSGPDQKISLDPSELNELVIGCNAVKQALGDSKFILKNEKPIRKFAEASIVTTKTIEKGEKFTLENIGTKRPGTGDLHANKFYEIIGKNAKKSIKPNKQLTWKDIV
ncbi:N-acetylneuraminate synthase family protein [Nitrosopumilus sp.]|uniref:N-acetylneuraminate synthase family protein n=1 Tax=Nitrosopumilus sp. TaxID=2024843 RepID=UPI00247E70B9|nr:N-acetylneuraminate synthase family protein [Nitrosopumilus sp.]MCV0430388.1 N-acetylneuraminate synthase family protein [Nitrosopumilus sp.]